MITSAEELWSMNRRTLLDVLVEGHRLWPEDLADKTYRGVSLGLPALVERLTWKKFQKVFAADGERVRGWNVRLKQNGVEGDDVPLEKRGEIFAFGHFVVRETTHEDRPRYLGRDVPLDRALMLDYGIGGNGVDLVATLRDPLVAVNEGDASLLLGWSYLQVGPLLTPTPSFFTLEEVGPRDHLAVP